MIAKYKGMYFNVDLDRFPIRIWRYDYVKGFTKKVHPTGLIYYEKYVFIWQLEKVFDVGFSVCWDGEWCGVFFAEEQNLLELHTAEDDFAEAHNMEKIERGAYITAKSADDFKEYRMWIEDERTGKETYTMLSYDEFKYYWRVLEAELISPRPPYNND